MSANTPKTWRELKAEGVKRCNAYFSIRLPDGTRKHGCQCKRRASANFDFEWCERHGPIMAAVDQHNLDMIELGKGRRRRR